MKEQRFEKVVEIKEEVSLIWFVMLGGSFFFFNLIWIMSVSGYLIFKEWLVPFFLLISMFTLILLRFYEGSKVYWRKVK